MTVELQNHLDAELAEAVKSGDTMRILRVNSRILSALMDCQRKTADRVKQHLIECDRAKCKIEGVKILWATARYIAAAGGGAALLKLLTGGAA